jgi:hypothetical protein
MPDKTQGGRALHLEWWAKRFAGLTVAEITPDRIAEARDALAAEPFTRGKSSKVQKRSGATVNRYLATLSSMFSVAVKEWRLVERNPVRDITKRKEGPRPHALSDRRRAREAARGLPPLGVERALSAGTARADDGR